MHILFRYLHLILGFSMISFGFSMMIRVSTLGLEPWSAAHVGLSQVTFTIGMWALIFQFIYLFLTIWMEKKPPQIGTLINAVMLGPGIDLFLRLPLFPEASTTHSAVFLFVSGIFISCFGSGLAIASKLGPGPKTQFYVVVSKRMQWSLRKSKTALEAVGVAIALSAGGPIFIGTIVFAVISGPIVQFSVSFWNKAFYRNEVFSASS